MTNYHIEELTYAYQGAKSPAINGINLSISQGEIVAVLGPNGAGKTTLIRQMLGLLKPTSGKISLFGEDVIKNPRYVGRYVSYLSQEGLGPGFGHLRAFEAVVFTGMLRDLNKQESQEQAQFWIERLGLSSIKNSLIKNLSGGEKRLISLAASFIGERPIIVIDEPTNDLDPEARRRVWEILGELRQTRKMTVILVTHNILEADQVVDNVAVLEKGRLLAYEEIHLFRRRTSGLRMEIFPASHDPRSLPEELARYGAVEYSGGSLRVLTKNGNSEVLLRFLEEQRQKGFVREWRMRTPNLEDAYFALAGNGARDDS